jgi:hypothetical protein
VIGYLCDWIVMGGEEGKTSSESIDQRSERPSDMKREGREGREGKDV